MPSQPIVKTAIQDIVAENQAADLSLNLLDHFDDPFTTGLVAQFSLYNTALGNGGITNVVLYDQAGAGAPQSVQNFLNYVNAGSYTNSIIHRSLSGFIIQGGGFTVDGLASTLATPGNAVSIVPRNTPVQNEFSTERSNLRGTIAYAKIGGDPDSATSQWFFNLADNSSNLDNQNGGFTVFGEVVSAIDLLPVDVISILPTENSNQFFGQTAFSNVPVITGDISTFQFSSDNDFARYQSITVSQQDELSFEIVGNTNPGLVTPSFNGTELVLDYVNGQAGTTNLTVRATNLQGQTIDDSFALTVLADRTPGDLNRDGRQDLLWVNEDTGALAYWSILELSNTADSVQRDFLSTSSLEGLEVIELLDYDQDGDSDILTRNYATSENRVFIMDGTQQVGEVLVGENFKVQNQDWRLQAAGNFDQDGESEMLWRNAVTGGFAFWDLTGEIAQSSFVDLTVLGLGNQGALADLNWQIKAVADFDNDGKQEVVWRNEVTGQNALWTLNGNVLESSVFLPELGLTDWDIVDAADYDQDGIVDLAWRNATTGQNVVWKLGRQGDEYVKVDGFFLPSLSAPGWSVV